MESNQEMSVKKIYPNFPQHSQSFPKMLLVFPKWLMKQLFLIRSKHLAVECDCNPLFIDEPSTPKEKKTFFPTN